MIADATTPPTAEVIRNAQSYRGAPPESAPPMPPSPTANASRVKGIATIIAIRTISSAVRVRMPKIRHHEPRTSFAERRSEAITPWRSSITTEYDRLNRTISQHITSRAARPPRNTRSAPPRNRPAAPERHPPP